MKHTSRIPLNYARGLSETPLKGTNSMCLYIGIPPLVEKVASNAFYIFSPYNSNGDGNIL